MTVALVADAGRVRGLGHVMRCLALAEQLAPRGLDPVFVADLADLPWAVARLAERDLTWVPPGDDPAGTVLGLAPAAAVLDSYHLPESVGHRLRAAGVPVLAIVDGDSRPHPADLYLDQNLGATPDALPGPGLAGLRYALHRADVVRHRPAAPRTDDATPPRVLAFFGGTDPFAAAPVLAGALAATGVPYEATVVAATPELAARVRAVPGPHEVIGPSDELPRLVTGADLVVAASGTSAWELACLGAAAALVCVVDNQEVGYARAVATGAVAGLGRLSDLRTDPSTAVPVLRRLLTDPAERQRLRAAAWHLVDGAGAARVADALAGLIVAVGSPRM
ncbi:PseG/SpsG family protein [Actinocatenispora rupis]|uniref:UDP-2,4-diacetamido-2,4,6-trideoxy-beta-L-altropy ranose hydrolase n=1 Tax=Actinocatenispora rupis TaxID=519421 RepID=A0A8J3IZ31_9ACTN|nr:spore coat protein [Actinocatenispora rupis]GID11460.1 UDP-2,4-diacetamido-2,4,6-trideoxy-beta-L-altropy ranose hydrolase [Actinocatenispora rupis]